MIVEMHPPQHWAETQAFKSALVKMAREGRDCRDAIALGYFPVVAGNPFQQLLYSAADQAQFLAQPISAPKMPLMQELGARPVLHLHWVHRLLGGVARERDALNRIARLVLSLREQQQRGVRIVWTVHNLQSHRPRYPVAEESLRRELAAVADIIHVMNPDTRDLYADIADLDPKKTIWVPHPSYEGAYDLTITRDTARSSFGLEDGQICFLAFGKLQRQKGLRRLIDAFIDAQDQHFAGKARLIIAGEAVEPDFVAELQASSSRPDISLITERVAEADVARYFRAADVVVCPYEQSLNSGVAVTASGMGRVVLLREDLAGAFHGHGHVVVMKHMTARALVNAVDRVQNVDLTASFARWADMHSPKTVSKQFFQMVRERLMP